MPKPGLLAAFLFAVIVAFSASSHALPTYSIVRLGFDDADHTQESGYRSSGVLAMNEAGQVVGHSLRYSGGSGVTSSASNSVWYYDGNILSNIGLTDSLHTRSNGYRLSQANQLNELGQVIGFSERYMGSNLIGRTAWLYGYGATVDIGLTDAEHTGSGGIRTSFPGTLNDTGHVAGYSNRYNGGTANLGRTAWVYNGNVTSVVGFTDLQHTRTDGYKYSLIDDLNQAGQATGYSLRFTSAQNLGRSVWFYDGSATIDIGLNDSEHSRPDGYRYSSTTKLTEAGHVIGYSNIYDRYGENGRSAWIFNGTSTRDIGLPGSDYVAVDGYKFSDALDLNESGQAVGYSRRFDNVTYEQSGEDAWLFDGTSTVRLGLTSSEYTRDDGYQYSGAYDLNGSGYVLGFSRRYNGTRNDRGRSVWRYADENTVVLGFSDAEHTNNVGYKYSEAVGMNSAGQVIGFSDRYNGSASQVGQSAWIFDGAATVSLGLTGPEFTSDDGYKHSEAQYLNENGQVAGNSVRFNGSEEMGQTAWFFDASLGQTIPLLLSVTSDGYAWSEILYLGEDGLVLGRYDLFQPGGSESGEARAFYFTPTAGMQDLGSLVQGGIPSDDWESLAAATRANIGGQILGKGVIPGDAGGVMPFIMTPQLVGDFDNDGDVDGRDFLAWQRDPNVGDLSDWHANYGVKPLNASTIPEPSSLALAVFSILSFRRRAA